MAESNHQASQLHRHLGTLYYFSYFGLTINQHFCLIWANLRAAHERTYKKVHGFLSLVLPKDAEKAHFIMFNASFARLEADSSKISVKKRFRRVDLQQKKQKQNLFIFLGGRGPILGPPTYFGLFLNQCTV